MCHTGMNSSGCAYDFNGKVECGEIWDRYRTLDEKKPNSGLAYSLFNLRALVYTAHIIDNNRNRKELACCPQPSQEDQAMREALLQALHFYGKYYILYPVGTPAHIAYDPYRGQQPLPEGLAEFLVARRLTR